MQTIIDFILEIDRLKGVEQKARPVGMARFENPAEHSRQVSLLALLLVPDAKANLNVDRVTKMLLVHDLGEIDAGDSFVFAAPDLGAQNARERNGVSRLLADLPGKVSASLLKLRRKFDKEVSAEARFAHSGDGAMPVLLNLANKGGSWRERGITYERVIPRVGPKIEASWAPLWGYIQVNLREAYLAGWLDLGKQV